MSSECDALRTEIQRLRQEIAGLNNRFILKSDRPNIIQEGLTKFKEIHPTLFGGLFAASVLPYSIKIDDNSLAASLAKESARVADGKAVNAASKAQLAENISTQTKLIADANRLKISTVETVANGAKNLAQTAEGVADAASAAVRTLDGKVARVAGDVGEALRKAANAVGISNRALGLAGQVFRGLFRALALIDILFGILAAVTVAQQLAAIIRRLNIIEATLGPIYGLIGVNRAKAAAAAAAAEQAFQRASTAQATATTAQSQANSAQGSANSALQTALQALSLVGTLLFLRSLIPQLQQAIRSTGALAQRALSTAQSAQTAAQQALQRQMMPGPRGLPGLDGRPGQRGAPGQRGERGAIGAPGIPGRAGATGQRGPIGAPGIPGRAGAAGQRGARGPQGLKGEDGELSPADSALLRKIDATTTADLAVDRQNQQLIQGQRGIALANLNSSIANGKGIGLERFPAAVPTSLNANATGATSINNLADLQVWQAKNLDSVMGVWPAKMNVESVAGVAQAIEMNTTSDMLQEIYGMMLALTIGQGIQTQIGTKTLIEAGATKQQAFLAHQYSAANADFLGYQGQRTTAQMPMSFAPGKDLLDGMLAEGSVPVQGWKNTQRDTLGTKLNELLQAAAIIKAVFYRKIDPNNIEESIRGNVEAQADFTQRDQATQDEGGDWSQYLADIETAFNQPEPYGRNPAERPKIIDRTNLNNGDQPQP